MENVEKIFYQDISNKKRTGCGIFKRATRKFIRGGVKTQYDFLSTKERKRLNGEVRVYNMYEKYKVIENCPTREELLNMPKEEAKNILTFMKNNHTNAVLLKHFGLHSGSLYNLYKTLGVEYGSKPRKPKDSSVIKEIKPKKNKPVVLDVDEFVDDNKKDIKCDIEVGEVNTDVEKINYEEIVDRLYEKLKPEPKVKSNFTLNITGEYSKEELDARISAVSVVIIDGKRYKVNIDIEEL